MQGRYRRILILGLFAVTAIFLAQAQAQDSAAGPAEIFSLDMDNEPIYIKADSLTLKAKERQFTYTGNIEAKQGEMIITAQTLQGSYNEKNEIDELVALKNVVITKGPEVTARGERAVFNRLADTVTLTENPELQQKDSVLTADRIVVFLKENRSVAEGEVRMKLTQSDEKGKAGAKGKTGGSVAGGILGKP